MNPLFKKYHIRFLLIGLYGIFFVTQIFSVTTNTGAQSSCFIFHVYQSSATADTNAGEGLYKDESGFTVKTTGGFRLNKRFQPSEFEFLCSPELLSLQTPVQDNSQSSYFSERPILRIFLLNQCQRGPPGTDML